MSSHPGHLAGIAMLGLIIVVVMLAAIALFSKRYRRRTGLAAAWAVGGLAGLYLVVRGVAEFFVIHYGDPASYRSSWGGPSLAGVFLVHSGPGFLVLVAAAFAWRRTRSRRAAARAAVGGDRGARTDV